MDEVKKISFYLNFIHSLIKLIFFINKVEILRKIDHPGVVGIKDVYDTEDNLYLVLEL